MPQNQKNWTDINPNFTIELQAEWEKWGFSIEEVHEWIKVGLNISEAKFTKWLVNKGYVNKEGNYRSWQEKVYDQNKKNELENDYIENWGNIHTDFGKQNSDYESYAEEWKDSLYNHNSRGKEQEIKKLIELGFKPEELEIVKKWKFRDFSASEIEKWLLIGLKKEDWEFADILKQQGYSPELVKNRIEEMKNRFIEKNKTRLDQNYPKDQRSEIEKLDLSNQNLEGEVDLSDFINLKKVNISYNPKLSNLKGERLDQWSHDKGKNVTIKNYHRAQEWLDKKYLDKNEVKEIQWEWKDREKNLGLKVNGFIYNSAKGGIAGELTVANFPNLEILWIGENKLTELKVLNCPKLNKIYCANNKLSDLILRNCPSLTNLTFFNNKLTNLDLSNCKNLVELNCSSNYFNKIDLSDCPQLRTLICQDNNLKSLETSNNPLLTKLFCDKNFSRRGEINHLTTLDLSKNKRLDEISCSGNELTELDLSNQTQLTSINCSDNLLKIIKLPISGQEKLTHLYLYNNNFSRPKNLQQSWFINNQPEEQDLSFLETFVNLETLWLGNNNEERINRGIYNRFYGSLEPLKNMKNLKSLRIENTDIHYGLEYLPLEKLKEFYYHFDKRINARVDQIFYALCDPTHHYLNKEFWKNNLEKFSKFQGETAYFLQKEAESLKENFREEKEKNYQLTEQNNNFLQIIEQLVKTISDLKLEKESLEKNFQGLIQTNQLEISQIKKDYEKKITELNEEVEELSNEFLQEKRNELERIVNDYKSKLEESYHGYLEAFIEENSKIARKHLLKKFDEKALKELSEKQQIINQLEKKVNKLSQQTQIEVLPPSYNY
ncbi:MAG: hypothetical protein mread185_000072 [Mycoplasmataceae bacterium]|nr:MAG: hypothetical protein mread185_000072 [Mycoplasmataceae bacterium]